MKTDKARFFLIALMVAILALMLASCGPTPQLEEKIVVQKVTRLIRGSTIYYFLAQDGTQVGVDMSAYYRTPENGAFTGYWYKP